MSQLNTVVRSLDDVGLAAWFGGSLMGAVGLNKVAASVRDPGERTSVATVGWKHWAPIQLAAVAAHGLGGAGLTVANKSRLDGQPEARTNTGVKLALILVAVGGSLYSGLLGARMAANAVEDVTGTTEPSSNSSAKLKSA